MVGRARAAIKSLLAQPQFQERPAPWRASCASNTPARVSRHESWGWPGGHLRRRPGSASFPKHPWGNLPQDPWASACFLRLIAQGLERLGWTELDRVNRPKGDPAKLELARQLRGRTTLSVAWVARGLSWAAGRIWLAAQKPQHQQAHAARTAGSDTACDVITSLTDPVLTPFRFLRQQPRPRDLRRRRVILFGNLADHSNQRLIRLERPRREGGRQLWKTQMLNREPQEND